MSQPPFSLGPCGIGLMLSATKGYDKLFRVRGPCVPLLWGWRVARGLQSKLRVPRSSRVLARAGCCPDLDLGRDSMNIEHRLAPVTTEPDEMQLPRLLEAAQSPRHKAMLLRSHD